MINVNTSLCIGCKQCVLICPACIMQLDSTNTATCINDKICINCAHCFAICPEGAISINGINSQDVASVEKINFSLKERNMLFKARRSIRVFKKGLVPHDLIMQALNDAAYAPTATNAQKVQWILIENPNAIQQLVKEVAEFIRSLNLPRYIGYLKMYDSGKEPFLRGANQIILAHTPQSWEWGVQDASAAISYLELSLHSQNIGTCWSGFVIKAAQAGKTPSIGLPQGQVVYGGLMFGYSGVEYARLPIRKDVRLIIK